MSYVDPTLRRLLKPGIGFAVVEPGEYDFDTWNGRLLVWEPPRAGFRYALGVDVAEGVGGDRSVVEVLRCGTLEAPDIQVAEYASDFLDTIEFSRIVDAIGRFYRDDEGYEAFATVEANGPGKDVIATLNYHLSYTNQYVWKFYDKRTNLQSTKLGWWTTAQTRPRLIARAQHALSTRDLVLNSPFLLDEMADFHGDLFMAKAQARSGRHDDRVMAMLMAYWGAHDDEWLAGEDLAEERRLLTAARKSADAGHVTAESAPATRRDYQNTAITEREMWEAAESTFFGD